MVNIVEKIARRVEEARAEKARVKETRGVEEARVKEALVIADGMMMDIILREEPGTYIKIQAELDAFHPLDQARGQSRFTKAVTRLKLSGDMPLGEQIWQDALKAAGVE